MSHCYATEAVLGGAIIGLAAGLRMLTTGRVAGNSGAVKACLCLSDTPDYSNILYATGMIMSGHVAQWALPWALEAPPVGTTSVLLTHLLGGFFTGMGVHFCNGCTSGHGLAGISRLSWRSIAATPTFLGTAALVVMIKSHFEVGHMVPLAPTPEIHIMSGVTAAIVGVVLALPMLVTDLGKMLPYYSGAWCGFTFGLGLSVGGMVRASTVTEALGPKSFNPTLWILFTTALVTTFVLYRLAESKSIHAARAIKGGDPPDRFLIGGSVLFGIGWGLTGMCPGPLVVNLGAFPTDPSTLVGCAGVLVGMLVGTKVDPRDPTAVCGAGPPKDQ
eukprot:m.160305 g.160305  ORF g.160305 m.160305 type:complete len:331 (-) comp11926_c0_seq1:236-1228(-)